MIQQLRDAIEKLPAVSYDTIFVERGYLRRLVQETGKNSAEAGDLLLKSDVKFCGIRIVGNPAMPPTTGVLMSQGWPVGVVNLETGETRLLNTPALRPTISIE